MALRAQGVEASAIKTGWRSGTRCRSATARSGGWSAGWSRPDQSETFVRVEVPPGSEAQVDFGAAGRAIDPADGRMRKAWVFVLVLAWSRHSYAEVVFDQRVETWLLCHRHGFEFFGGVPQRVVLDNLKAAIIKASLHDRSCSGVPRVRPALRVPDRGAAAADAAPEGKVEQGGVHYVARNFLAGREAEPLDVLNRKLRHWLVEVAGARIHGTTKAVPSSGSSRPSARRCCPAGGRVRSGPLEAGRGCTATATSSSRAPTTRCRSGWSARRSGSRRRPGRSSCSRPTTSWWRRTIGRASRRPPDDAGPPAAPQAPGLLAGRETCRAQAEAIGRRPWR